MPDDPGQSADPTRVSKLLSRALRHAPREFGLTLDNRGFAPLDAVLAAIQARLPTVRRADIERLAAPADKQRFEIVDGRIRATYGHSVAVDPAFPVANPPTTLYHGTARRFVPSILSSGLVPGKRQYVHLSETTERARMVGLRRDAAPGDQQSPRARRTPPA